MAAGESTSSQLPDCCMILKKIYVHVRLIEQIYTQNGSISCRQSDYLHFLWSVYIKQTFKNSNNSATRFHYSLVRQHCRSHQDIIHMFWGPLRSFHTNSDAINWHEHVQYLQHFLHHSHSVSHHICCIYKKPWKAWMFCHLIKKSKTIAVGSFGWSQYFSCQKDVYVFVICSMW